jgi:hypothetical protein
MVTTRIQIKPHLKEYISGKDNEFSDKPVRFPDQIDIYHLIFELTRRRPIRCPVDDGNIEIILPEPRSSKHPETYNYLNSSAQKMIQRKVEVMFWSELREYIDYEHYRNGTNYIESACSFMKKYEIKSITEDALLKNYYRWRKKIRNPEKRAYNFKKS